MIKENFFKDRDALFNALANDCTDYLTQAVEQQSQVSFVTSGGTTPVPLYHNISNRDLGWSKINVALVDERWVDVNSEQSNEHMLKHSLLKNYGASAKFFGMKTHHQTAKDAVADVNKHYQTLSQPIDLMLLGMGPDGHTASLFPNSDDIKSALDIDCADLCTAIKAHKSAVTGDLLERMTLTLRGIVVAKRIVLLILGEEKLKVYKQALTATDPYNIPISAVLQQRQCPVSVYWAP